MSTLKSRIEGVVLGTAVGNAMGYPVEFEPVGTRKVELPLKYPKRTLRGKGKKVEALFSDDTQMTVAVLMGLLRAKTFTDLDAAAAEVAEEFVAWAGSPENNRAPGNACMSGCRALAQGADWRLAGRADAGGSGAAMRSQAYGIWLHGNIVLAGRWAALHAQMTHRHPSALEAAFLTAAIVAGLVDGETLSWAVEHAFAVGGCYDPRTLEKVRKAWKDAGDEKLTSQKLLTDFPGWRSDDALCAALVCARRSHGNFEGAVYLAIEHTGDCDTVGAIVGAIMGGWLGIECIRTELKVMVEKSHELSTLAARLGDAVTPKVP